MTNYKPQSPLTMNNQGIFPLTTYDQVILPDNSRWDGSTDNVYIGAQEPTERYDLWVDTTGDNEVSVPLSSIMYIAFTIESDQWGYSNNMYFYQFSRNGISVNHAVFNLTLDEESQNNQSGVLNWTTGENYVILSTQEKPGGPITGYMMLLPVTDRTEG